MGGNRRNLVEPGPGGRFSARWEKMGRIADQSLARPPLTDWRRNNLTIDRDRERESGSRPISRVLSRATIHLGRASPRASSDLPGSFREQRVRALWPACFPIWPCSRWGLPCRRMLPPTRCALTAPFHPYRRRIAAALRRFAFCCTFRGLAPPRRYLAPCSMEPGLSSAKKSQRLPGRLPRSVYRPGADPRASSPGRAERECAVVEVFARATRNLRRDLRGLRNG